jgi:hypothetical protein
MSEKEINGQCMTMSMKIMAFLCGRGSGDFRHEIAAKLESLGIVRPQRFAFLFVFHLVTHLAMFSLIFIIMDVLFLVVPATFFLFFPWQQFKQLNYLFLYRVAFHVKLI